MCGCADVLLRELYNNPADNSLELYESIRKPAKSIFSVAIDEYIHTIHTLNVRQLRKWI